MQIGGRSSHDRALQIMFRLAYRIEYHPECESWGMGLGYSLRAFGRPNFGLLGANL
jgi:hypothetical protein